MDTVQIVTGPPVQAMSKEKAEAALRSHALFPKQASVTLEDVNGTWVAAIALPGKTAAPAFEESDGKNDGEESGGSKPPSDSGESDGPPSGDEGPPGLGDEGGDKPKKPSVEEAVGHLTDIVTQIATALGLPVGGGAGPVPGMDAGPPAPPPGPPGGPPAGPPAGGPPGGKQHMVHERALKPGEAQPGTTPLGAPAFASVREDHPWREMPGHFATFTVEETIGEEPTQSVANELRSLASEIGYNVRQFRVEGEGNQRIARALISNR
jgi:hypothetical protein